MANKKEQILATLGGYEPQNKLEGTSGGENVDYYQLLKDESYKTMLSKEIQASVAQDNALKYTNNAVKANGYGNQGLSESARVGIANGYSKALMDAQADHEQNLMNINQQEHAAAEDEFNSFATLMSSATSSAQLADILNGYGITVGEDGKLGGDFYNKLDANSQRQLNVLYGMYASEFENSDWLSNNTLTGVGFRDAGAANQNIAAADGSVGSVANELNYIFSDEYMKDVKENHVVKLVHGSNDKKYVYMIYRNGAWYQTSASVYNNAGDNKEIIKGK